MLVKVWWRPTHAVILKSSFVREMNHAQSEAIRTQVLQVIREEQFAKADVCDTSAAQLDVELRTHQDHAGPVVITDANHEIDSDTDIGHTCDIHGRDVPLPLSVSERMVDLQLAMPMLSARTVALVSPRGGKLATCSRPAIELLASTAPLRLGAHVHAAESAYMSPRSARTSAASEAASDRDRDVYASNDRALAAKRNRLYALAAAADFAVPLATARSAPVALFPMHASVQPHSSIDSENDAR